MADRQRKDTLMSHVNTWDQFRKMLPTAKIVEKVPMRSKTVGSMISGPQAQW